MRFETRAVFFLVGGLAAAGCSSEETRPSDGKSPRASSSRREPRVAPAKPVVVWLPSPYFDPAERTPVDVDTVAIHSTEGGYNEKLSFAENQERNYRGTANYFLHNDRSVSAHFLMGPHGEITQLVAEKDVAWTTTYYNRRSFGIECAGWAGRKETWTPELMASLADLVAYLCVRWDVRPEHAPGDAIRGPLKMTSRGFMGFNGTGLVGHYQVQTPKSEPVTKGKLAVKTDPGKHFPWENFVKMVQARIRGPKA